MGWTGHVVGMGWIRHAQKILVGKSQGNRIFTILRESWETIMKRMGVNVRDLSDTVEYQWRFCFEYGDGFSGSVKRRDG